jgi:hypothetical protein
MIRNGLKCIGAIGLGAAMGITSAKAGGWALVHGWDRIMNPSAARRT